MIQWLFRLLIIVPLVILFTGWIAITSFGPKIIKRTALLGGIDAQAESVSLGLTGLTVKQLSLRRLDFPVALSITSVTFSPVLRPRAGLSIVANLLNGTCQGVLPLPSTSDSIEIREVKWRGLQLAELPQLASLGVTSGSTSGSLKRYHTSRRSTVVQEPVFTLDQVGITSAPAVQYLKLAKIKLPPLPTTLALSASASSTTNTTGSKLHFTANELALGSITAECVLPHLESCTTAFALTPEGSRIMSSFWGVRVPLKGQGKVEGGRLKIVQ